MTEMIPVKSSAMQAVGLSEEHGLIVRFVRPDKLCAYMGVSEQLFDAMLQHIAAGGSAGVFLNEQVKKAGYMFYYL